MSTNTLRFFYKQLTLGWQIAKQLPELNPQIKEKWSFSFAIDAKQLLNRQYTKIELSQKRYWENFKITDHELLSQTIKQLLSNFEPQKP